MKKMVQKLVECPFCKSVNIVKYGKDKNAKQIYQCRNKDCAHNTFVENYTYEAKKPEVKEKIFTMAINGSGIRDTARVLGISPSTVINELKKRGLNSKCKFSVY